MSTRRKRSQKHIAQILLNYYSHQVQRIFCQDSNFQPECTFSGGGVQAHAIRARFPRDFAIYALLYTTVLKRVFV